jgi:hypothetical protein
MILLRQQRIASEGMTEPAALTTSPTLNTLNYVNASTQSRVKLSFNLI